MKPTTTHTRASRAGGPGPAEGSGGTRWRHVPKLTVLLVGVLACGWIASRQLMTSGPLRDLEFALTRIALPILAGMASIRVRRRSDIDTRAATGWLFVGTGCLIVAVGGIAALIPLADSLGAATATAWALAHHLSMLLLAIGVLYWVQRFDTGATLGLLLDMSAITLLGIMVAWNSSLRSALLAPSGPGFSMTPFERFHQLVWPIGGILLLVAAVSVLGQIGRRDLRGPIVIATFGAVAIAASHLYASSYAAAGGEILQTFRIGEVQRGGSVGDAGWAIGFALVGIAAVRMGHVPRRNVQHVPLLERSATWESVWVMVPFALLATAIIAWQSSDQSNPAARFSFQLLVTLLIARCSIVALHNLRMSRTANTDPLTGAFNHRYFQEQVTSLAAAALATHRPLSLVMIDVDNFAMLNESTGHAEGDRFLREIAYVAREQLGDNHLLFRFGGDEFALALPDTSAEAAEAIATSIGRQVARLRTPATAGPPSLTIGIATLPTHTRDAHELVQLADGTLYWSKLNGKGRVTVYDPAVVKVMSTDERVRVVEQHAQLRATLALARALDARDSYTARHSENVSRIAVAIAAELGWSLERQELLRVAGLLHDVGKIGVRDATLRKASRLTPEEWEEMRRHPILSARVIAGVAPEEILPWVIGHHERMDGRGYPRGLAGEQVPMGARIIAVADSFDAMTSSRSYRPGVPVPWAIREIASLAGEQFDPEVIRAFLAAMRSGLVQVTEQDVDEVPDFVVEFAPAAFSTSKAPAPLEILDPEFSPVDYVTGSVLPQTDIDEANAA